MKTIDAFKGKYFFLSNFYEAPVMYNGILFQNNEAAFQAQKDESRVMEFVSLKPNQAKKLGRSVKLDPAWDAVKKGIMYDIVEDKFIRNPDLKEKLLATGDAELIEGNTWGDTYWGVCNGKGGNALGHILMLVREELRNHEN